MENQAPLLTAELLREESAKNPQIDAEAKRKYKEFADRFNYSKLENLSDDELLTYVFRGLNNTNLCDTLEFGILCKDFGSIRVQGGVSAYGLYNRKKDGKWCASYGDVKQRPLKDQINDPIAVGRAIVNDLANGARFIEKWSGFDTEEGYKKLYEDLFDVTHGMIGQMWFLKYYHMLFPNFFSTFYTEKYTRDVLDALGLSTEGDFYTQLGRIACFIRNCGISSYMLGYIFWIEVDKPRRDNKKNKRDDKKNEIEDNSDYPATADELEEGTSSTSDAEPIKPPYDKEMFLNEVFITEKDYDRIRSTLEYKKNIILQGPPGVGKTFAAKRLAYSMMGKKDDGRICIVQFHQNFSYEDFVMGYKPKKEGGYELKYGSFYNFCKKAEKDPENDYFFIIDEINRGNISKIFGELLMLIENEYRGKAGRALGVSLAYEEVGEPFSVPENLYIIGMMNTADRSLALIDYALRRRFSFFEMKPAFGTVEDDKVGGFWNYVRARDSRLLEKLIETTQRLNEDIKKTLGSGFMIGHSYFCGLAELTDEDLAERLKAVVYCDIIPTLKEYWFDDERDLKIWEDEFSKVI